MNTADDIRRDALLPENHGPYTLYRADTHSTETVIVEKISETFAKTAIEIFEHRPHHQGYWYRVPEQKI